MTNNWMDDPAVAHIDKAKLDFLQSLVFESQSLTKEQMLPFLMSVAKKAMYEMFQNGGINYDK